MDRLIDLLAHACAAKLVAAIAEDADEAVLKAAVGEFPAIVAEMMRELAEKLAKD